MSIEGIGTSCRCPDMVAADAGQSEFDVLQLLDAPLGSDMDGILAMYALMMANSRQDGAAKLDDIRAANEQRHQQWERRLAEMRKSSDELDKGGVWKNLGDAFGKIAQVGGIVAAVALTVATCGAGGPVAALAIAGLVLSSAAMIEGQTGCISKGLVDAGVLDEKQAQWTGTALALLGAACSGGAAIGQALGAGAQLAGASKFMQGARTLGNAASVVAGGSAVLGAGAMAAYADAVHDAAEHDAHAAEAMMRQQMIMALIEQLVSDLEEINERETAQTRRMTQICETSGQTMMMLASGVAPSAVSA